MKKRRFNMYELLIKNSKSNKSYGKDFFLSSYPEKKNTVKIVISQKIVEGLSLNMQEMSDFMTRTILEGILSGRK